MNNSHSIPPLKKWAFPFEEDAYIRGVIHSNSDKPFINFIHGNGFCGQAYWSFLKELTGDYSLLIQDCVGHGDSDEGSGFQSWEQSAEHAYEVLKNKLDRGIIQQPLIGMGHSFGGVLTIKMAVKYPELFKGLVLLDPILMPEVFLKMKGDLDIPNPLAAKTRLRKKLWSDREEALAYFKTKSAYNTWSDCSLENFVEHALDHQSVHGVSLKCPPAVEAAIFSSSPDGLWDDIEKLQVPTTILYGKQSYPFIEGSCQKASENPNINIVEEEGGHCFLLEHPQRVASITKKYLREIF